jgi:hypothetical protein
MSYPSPAYLEQVAAKVSKWCLRNFGIRNTKVTISIQNLETYYGDCGPEKDGSYTVVIAQNQNLRSFVQTLVHEHIHVKQFVGDCWEGSGEKEASLLEGPLADQIWKENIL